MVSESTRTQISALDDVIPEEELEAVDVSVSEVSQLLVLSVVIELLEAAKVDARRVGGSSLDGVEFSLKGPLNHEPPQENKPTEGTKQTKKLSEVRGAQLLQTERIVQKSVKSDKQSKKHLMDSLGFAKGDKISTSKLSEVSINCFFSITVPAPSTLQYDQLQQGNLCGDCEEKHLKKRSEHFPLQYVKTVLSQG